MENDSVIQPENSNVPVQLRPYQYRKGQTGNPHGRPKGSRSLKEYAKEMLLGMTDEEREEFLHGLDKKDIWEMGEGKAHQTNDTKVDGAITVSVINYEEHNDTPQLPTDESKG